MQKLLFIVLAILVNFSVQWYAHHAGKLSDAGSLFGWHYNSTFLSSLLLTIKYVWFFILANALYTYAFKIGETHFETFIVAMILWIAAAPVATLLYNSFILKQPINWLHFVGILLVLTGSICVAANQEILKWMDK